MDGECAVLGEHSGGWGCTVIDDTPPSERSEIRDEGEPPGDRAHVRSKAIDVLLEAEAERSFVDEVLSGAITAVDHRNRPLLQEIVYGVMRHRNTLDALIDFYLKLPIAKQRAEQRAALRVGAYQLVYLSKIPPHAAVYQTI